jgi:3-oxoacyl-[acyl-carrier protein] reductase
MTNLKGKIALVTGGSRGIGAAIAKRLGQDGASVAITYVSSPAKAEEVVTAILEGGSQAIAIQADSGNAEQVRGAVTRTAERFGGLDILVNSAGIARVTPIEEFSQADFERMLAVNVQGVFAATQEAVRHMKAGGRVIMLGSINSEYVPFVGGSIYALTKAALVGFTHGLARDLGPRGITVNNIQPGPVDTDMNPADGPFAAAVKGTIALQRYGRPEEIAALASFLCSDDAAFITGASLKADGGASA